MPRAVDASSSTQSVASSLPASSSVAATSSAPAGQGEEVLRLSAGSLEVQMWLTTHGLDQYVAPLLAAGYNRLVLLRCMGEDEENNLVSQQKMPIPHARDSWNKSTRGV